MRKKVFLAIAGLIVLSLLAWTVFSGEDEEPRYRGKSLSVWLDKWEWTIGSRSNKALLAASPEAEVAIQTIGTNAFPTISKWMSFEPSPLRRRLVNVAQDLPLPDAQKHVVLTALSDPDAKLRRANTFFIAFGSNASPMIPELMRLMKITNSVEKSRRAAFGLSHIGTPALPQIKETLADTNSPVRANLIFAIGFAHRRGDTDWSAAMPIMLQYANDGDPSVARVAIRVLGFMKLQPEDCIPILTNKLQSTDVGIRRMAMLALGDFGGNAASVVPSLVPILSDPDVRIRRDATNAIEKISPGFF